MSPLPGSTDGNPIKNVTSRKKTRPKPVDDDSDYEISGSSSAKKKRYNRINAHGAGPSSRRKLNLSFLPTETKKKEHGKGREAESNDGESLETAVHKILGSHLMLRKFLNSNNCFEHKTVLDIINNEIVRNESMADMAMILNSAVEVYGFRVDRCYLHVQDTRGHITSSFNAKHNNELHNDPIRGSPKRRKRDDIKQNIGDWKARLNEDGEHELDIANEDEDEGSGRRHIPEEDSEIFLDNIPSNREELSSFLDDLMEQRKNINDKIHSTNTHIVENGDDLMDKTNKELSSNEYYQKAVSRYGEGNSAAMLMNNAKFSSESHAYLIHSRIIANETKTVESLSYDFIKQVKSTLANSLSAAPKKIENDLLPAINEVYHNSDEETDEEDNFTATAADEFIEPCAQTENIPRSPKSKTSELRRSIIFRGKNMTIERTWVADDAELHLAADLYSDNDKEDFSRFENYRRDGVHQEEKGKLPPELELSTADLKDRSKYFELSGIDEDVRELDNLWNSQIVKNVVTAEQTAEMIRFVENSEDSPEEIHNKKLRILQPGDYVFFVGNTTEENPLIPVDSWREEGAEPALDVGGDDVFYDAEDDFGEIGEYEDLPNGTETNNISVTNSPFDAESVMDDVRLAMERETPIEDGDIGETVKLEDIADVPVNPGMIPDKPDEAIRNLGKEDNAHWKGSKNAETLAGDIKKQKKSRMLEEKSTTTDEYWAPSDAEMRRRALNKYSARPSTSVEREDALIFHPRPPKRAVFDLYNFEDFNKVSCLDGEIALSGNSWDRSLRKKHLLDKHLSLYDVPTFNEDGDESMGIEWMRALRGFRLRKTADEQQLAAPEDDSALPIASSMDDHVSDDDDGMEYSLDVENLLHDHNYEDHIKYDVDSPGVESYHTAPPGSNSPDQDFNQAIETLPWMTRKNKLQEIRELQAAEDIEEEGEIAEGLEGGTAIIIRNTSIDQSKVKSYLKNILTNRMMDKKCLKTVIEAANDHDYLDQTVAAVRELTLMNPGQDISMMNRSFEFKDTGIDPLEVSRIVFTTPDQATQTGQGLNTSTNQDGPSQEALTNAVVLSDFNIEGDHSLSSIMGCLPFRAQRSNEKNMHVALLFSIALQMCNENTLHCQQSSSNQESNWMGDFLLTNGSASQVKAPVDISRSKRPMRIMQEVIPEVDEPLDDSTLHEKATYQQPEGMSNLLPVAGSPTTGSPPPLQPCVASPPPSKTTARVAGIPPCTPNINMTTQQVAPQMGQIGSCSGDASDSNAEVLSVFECPVCLDYMLPPYLQCHSGHLVCGNCRPKLTCCPTCRGATPNVRNLGLEKIANTVRFPCKFNGSGCQQFFYHQEKVEHEEGCEFRPYSCPCPGASCKWQGALTDVMEHLKKIHKSITTLQGEDIVFLATDINLPGAVDWVMMQSCFGYNFMLVLEKQDREQGQQMFYAVVQLIGAKKEADNFMYRLELSTMRRRLAWEATPRSIHEGVAHAIHQSDCLSFDTSTAQLFAENGNLGINVTISMVETSPGIAHGIAR